MSEVGKLLQEPSMSAEVEESRPGYTSCANPELILSRVRDSYEKHDFES